MKIRRMSDQISGTPIMKAENYISLQMVSTFPIFVKLAQIVNQPSQIKILVINTISHRIAVFTCGMMNEQLNIKIQATSSSGKLLNP